MICLRNLFRQDTDRSIPAMNFFNVNFRLKCFLEKWHSSSSQESKHLVACCNTEFPSRLTTNRTRYQTQKSYNRLTKKNLEFCQVCQPTLSIFNFLNFQRRILGVRGENPPKRQRPHLLQAAQSHQGHRGLAMKTLVGELIACQMCIYGLSKAMILEKQPQQTAPVTCVVSKRISSHAWCLLACMYSMSLIISKNRMAFLTKQKTTTMAWYFNVQNHGYMPLLLEQYEYINHSCGLWVAGVHLQTTAGNG